VHNRGKTDSTLATESLLSELDFEETRDEVPTNTSFSSLLSLSVGHQKTNVYEHAKKNIER